MLDIFLFASLADNLAVHPSLSTSVLPEGQAAAADTC